MKNPESKGALKSLVRRLLPRRVALGGMSIGRWYLQHTQTPLGKSQLVEAIVKLATAAPTTHVVSTIVGPRIAVAFPDLIQRSLYCFGVWEPTTTRFIQCRLEPGDVFIDIGANIGYHSCCASAHVGTGGRVYAFEASPSIFVQLQHNLQLNDASNVVAANCAIMDSSKTISVFKADDNNIGRTTVVGNRANAHEFQKEASIAALSLLDAVPTDELFGARLIKIDVEGAETSIIDGIKDQISSFSPTTEWLIEVDGSRSETDQDHVAELVRCFHNAGYRMYQLENRYDLAWYIEDSQRILSAPAEALVEPLSTPPTGLADLVFSKRLPGEAHAP